MSYPKVKVAATHVASVFLDRDATVAKAPKQFHDVVGYYNRFDIFELKVNRTRLTAIAFEDRAEWHVGAAEGKERPMKVRS